MMRKMSVKKSLFTILLVVALVLSLVLVACGGGGKNNPSNNGGDKSVYTLTLDKTVVSLDKGDSIEVGYRFTKDGEEVTDAKLVVTVSNDNVTYDEATNKVTAVKVGNAIVTVKVDGVSTVSATMNITVPEYTIVIDGDDVQNVDLGAEQNIEYSVRKDGLKVSDKRVKITVVEGADLVTYTAIGNRIKFNEVGTAKIRVTLDGDDSVYAEKTYKITKSFWSSTYAVNKNLMTITDDTVTIPGGGNQYFLGVLEGGTKYVFKADIKLPSALASNQSIGLGHTIDENNSSLWFGIQGETEGDNYRLLIKNYYNTWANGRDMRVDGYNNIEFESKTISCITVRDGQNYWYSIGGLIGTYTANGDTDIPADRETWVGVYSQERELTITNFSYSTEDEDIDEAKAICEAECAFLNITNKNMTSVVKGSTVTYTANMIAAANKTPTMTWSLDKEGMTAGAENTTITDGVLSLDPDAAGTVVVKVECGGKTDSVTVNILQESLADENDVVTVDGGVVLGEDGSIEFPEISNGSNPTLNVNNYTDVFYSAKLKQTVKGDFSLSFKVTDLKTTDGSSYMVSFGDRLGNLFFTPTGVSLAASYVTNSDSAYNRVLNNNDTVTATFAQAEEYNITIAVVNGFWKVTVNEQELVFQGNVLRRVEDYVTARNILITTKAGTSMKVYDIEVTDGADSKYIILNGNTVAITDDMENVIGFESIMVPAVDGAWIGKDNFVSTTYYGEMLPAGDYTITFNVKFNEAMSDSKFAAKIGNWEFHVNNKIVGDGNIQGEIFPGSWSGLSGASLVTAVDKPIDVTIKKIGTTAYLYIGGTLIRSREGMPSDRVLSWWTFADGTAAINGKAAATDVVVRESAVIMNIDGASAIQAGTTSAAYTVSVIGSDEAPVWTMDDSTLTAGTATFDAAAHTLTFDNDAAGYVTIKVTVLGFESYITVTATSQPADQNTAIAESKGGVKQDVVNGKIIFDDAATNGVADEQRYSEASTYYAILNTAANTRAVIRDNFVLEFTVSDYVTTAQFPKLMISLGAKFEQFYIVYSEAGARIETFTSGTIRNTNGGEWINSAYFAAGFDTTASHVYKIVCEDGYYKVFVDGGEIGGWNTDGNSKPLFRSPESMAINRNVMFTTNSGTTATVSDITLSAVAGKEGKVTATFADWYKANDDGSIEVTMSHKSEDSRNTYHNATSIYSYGEYIPDNCTISVDVKFTAGSYNDEAVLIKFGSDRSIGVIYNSNKADGTKVEVQWAWGGTGMSTTDLENGIQVRITMTNGVVSKICFLKYNAEGVLGADESNVNIGGEAIPNIGVMSFGTFIDNDPSNNKVTISNVTVTAA